MSKLDTGKYKALMRSIKKRMEVVDDLIAGRVSLRYKGPTYEAICLQFRLIAETIALSTLVAHRALYEKTYGEFENRKPMRLVLREIAAVHPHFYPMPIKALPSATPGIRDDLVEVAEGFLTQEGLIRLHKKASALLHSPNPYRRDRRDPAAYDNWFAEWRAQISVLLNKHMVRIYGHDGFFIVHMQDRNSGEVGMFEFAPAASPSANITSPQSAGRRAARKTH